MEKLIIIHRAGGWSRLWTVPVLYLLNLLLALDTLVAALLGFDPRLTITAGFALLARKDCKLCKKVCAVLDKLDSRHCADSIANWNGYKKWDRSMWNLDN